MTRRNFDVIPERIPDYRTARISDYEQLLFPVRSVPVYAELNQNDEATRIRIPGQRAIVDSRDGHVFSVVSENYQLVTNRDALNYAYQCCEAAFPDIPSGAWRVSAADAPSTGSHCYIDLTEATSGIDFRAKSPDERPDMYGPFVRVTNSYNRTRALGISIGFMRKVCSNGMIIPQSSIRLIYYHNSGDIGARIRTRIDSGAFANLKEEFLAYLKPLRECNIPMHLQTRIALLALRIVEPEPEPESSKNRARLAWERLNDSVDRLREKYVDDLGSNAYALMNVVTDMATRPAAVDGLRRSDRNSLQCMAGRWLADFSTACAKSDFEPEKYAEKLQESVPRSPRKSGRSKSSSPPVPRRRVLSGVHSPSEAHAGEAAVDEDLGPGDEATGLPGYQ